MTTTEAPGDERGSRLGTLAPVVAIVGITALTFGADLMVGDRSPVPEVPERLSSLRVPATATAVFGSPPRVTVIRFWSASCGRCVRELRQLSASAVAFPDVRFVAGAVDVDPSRAVDAAVDVASGVVVLDDSKRSLAESLDISSVPATVILGRNREVLRQFNALPADALRSELEELPGENPRVRHRVGAMVSGG